MNLEKGPDNHYADVRDKLEVNTSQDIVPVRL